MEERRQNPSEVKCLWHSGIEEQLKSIRCKIDEREKLVNNQVQTMKDLMYQLRKEFESELEKHELVRPLETRIGILENTGLREEGSLTWRNHIVTALIAFSIFLLGHYLFKF